jgi:hypothetical protein
VWSLSRVFLCALFGVLVGDTTTVPSSWPQLYGIAIPVEEVSRRDMPDEISRTWILTTRDHTHSMNDQRHSIDAIGGVHTSDYPRDQGTYQSLIAAAFGGTD